MDIERRKFIRHLLGYPIETKIFHKKDREVIISTRSDNIGYGGLMFQSDRRIRIGTELEIDIKVEKRSFSADGVAVRCEKNENGKWDIGVSFTNISESLKVRMMEQLVRIEEFKKRLEKRYKVKLDFSPVAKEWIKRYSKAFAKRYYK